MSMIGKSFAHYEITGQLGKGGMGEVYQAKDRKLGRDVAIKVLPEEFAKDADRVARFQREAKVLASLNHTNIAAIHGLEESNGTNFLVLELVEGETLAERLRRGPIPVEEALKLVLQIAEALEAAHEKGVIHRDLKPANIKVTPDGKVKVLDFGLAKAYAGDKEELNLSNSPTLSNAATQQGIILGTAAYMSPEQAKGKPVDKRADIWAFGCVLYEMLTGRVAFQGEDVSEIFASVIKGDVKLDLLSANLHPRVREVIIRCLQMDLKRRYAAITDARYEIEQALADPGGLCVQPITAAEHRSKLRTMLPWFASAIVLGAIIAGFAVWKLKPSESPQVIRLDYNLPEGQEFNGDLAVSPNGKQFVYSTKKDLYIRSLSESSAKLIPGIEEGAMGPFFSPDGQWIGYFSASDHKLKKIAANGGVPVTLCDTPTFMGASWGEDNTIVYSQFRSGIMRISANGGTPESVVNLKPGTAGLIPLQVLPDGKSLLYTAILNWVNGQGKIMLRSLKSGESKELFTGVNAFYLPSGHIVYQLPDNNSLFAIPFDLGRLQAQSGAASVLEGISAWAISNSGTLVYVPQIPSATPASQGIYGRTLVWVDRKGKEEALHTPPGGYRTLRISPDGKRIALAIKPTDGFAQLWIWDLVRETMTRLTFDKWGNVRPIWTRDGRRIVFSSFRDNKTGIYWKASDGTGEIQQLGSDPELSITPYSLSNDGTLAIEQFGPDQIHADIGTLSVEGVHTRKLLLHEEYTEIMPNISPDGKYMAYASDESGALEVYVRPFPEVNKGKWQISAGGGQSPLWSPDGRELFYRNGDAVMAVPVDTRATLNAGKPRMLFQGTYVGGYGEEPAYDISPDGKRFLMTKPPATTPAQSAAAGPRKINIVLNWLEELKQRVPSK